MKTRIFLIAVSFSLTVKGQSTYSNTYLDYNNFNVEFNSFGYGFFDPMNVTAASEVPKGSGSNVIFASNLLMAAVNATTLDTHCFENSFPALPEHKQSSGPVADNYDSTYQLNFADLVWNIEQSQIDEHMSNWQSSSYNMPWVIEHWPANGDVNNGQGTFFAPFNDLNFNGIYEPAQGEHPCIKGDNAVYMMFNDTRETFPMWKNIFMEAHVMAYAFSTNDAVNNAVFVDYKLLNKSSNRYKDVYVGLQTDFDLGCANDDYMGSDSALSMQYVYNGDNDDENCSGLIGYGPNPPAAGIIFLSHPMTSSLHPGRGAGPKGDPKYESEFHNHLSGKWKDGTPIYEGGNGHVSDINSTSVTTKFHYSGNPSDTNTWSEISAAQVPFDRRGVAATGPFDFDPGQSIQFTVAYLYSRSSGDNLESVTQLKADAAVVRSFYNSQVQDCDNWAVGMQRPDSRGQIVVYPNPAQDRIQIRSMRSEGFQLQVLDLMGRSVIGQTAIADGTQSIDVSSWQQGIYIFRFVRENEVQIKRITIR